ncbi:hypothetical protein F5884DRAFT_863949 [Xylogone sp. PMI_703]|nr:hypothetical protein F5884DRAFT_863949 [Xylogone sp. PMI_703]
MDKIHSINKEALSAQWMMDDLWVTKSQVKEMEKELEALSTELAASTVRELALGDLVDRIQEVDAPTPLSTSAKHTNLRQDEIDRLQRRLNEERRAKENLEELLVAVKMEHEAHVEGIEAKRDACAVL